MFHFENITYVYLYIFCSFSRIAKAEITQQGIRVNTHDGDNRVAIVLGSVLFCIFILFGFLLIKYVKQKRCNFRPDDNNCTTGIEASFGAEASLDNVSVDTKETLNFKKDDPSNISAVVALYAKVDIVRKREQRKQQRNESELGTTATTTSSGIQHE